GILGLLPPFLYYVLLARSHGLSILEEFLLRHNMDRYVSGFDHAQSWWFFLARSPVDLLPGSLLLPAAAALRPSDPYRARYHRFLWLWTLLPLLFFSFSASKRPVYMLPALPAIAMLAGSVVESLRDRTAGEAARFWGGAGLGAALGA